MKSTRFSPIYILEVYFFPLEKVLQENILEKKTMLVNPRVSPIGQKQALDTVHGGRILLSRSVSKLLPYSCNLKDSGLTIHHRLKASKTMLLSKLRLVHLDTRSPIVFNPSVAKEHIPQILQMKRMKFGEVISRYFLNVPQS